IVERALERASQVGSKVGSVLTSDVAENIAGKLRDAVKQARTAVGQRLGAVEDAVASKSTAAIPVSDIGDKLGLDLAKSGYKVEGIQAGKVTQKLSPKTTELLA